MAPLVLGQGPSNWHSLLDRLAVVVPPQIGARLEAAKRLILEAGKGEPVFNHSAPNGEGSDLRREIRADVDLSFLIEKIYLAGDVAAHDFLQGFWKEPIIAHMRLFRVHAFAKDLWHILNRVRKLVACTDVVAAKHRSSFCVFCLRTNADFTSVEHIIPESLGNDEWILPMGWACDDCNKKFSVWERDLTSKSRILAWCRFMSPAMSKKGKFFEFRSEATHMIKHRHNSIEITSYAGKRGLPTELRETDHGIILQLPSVSERINSHLWAKMVAKAALAFVAIDFGPGAVAHPIFNPLRALLHDDVRPANRLWVGAADRFTLEVSLKISYRESWLVLDLWHLRLVLGLDTSNPIPPADQMAREGATFNLWSDLPGPHATNR